MGLQFIRPGTHFDFLGYRKIAYCISALLVVVGMVSLVMKGGPRYGVDFAGGMAIQVKIAKSATPEAIKASLDAVGLPHLVVQNFGQDRDNAFLIRASEHGDSPELLRQKVDQALLKTFGAGGYEVQRVEVVGPKVGADLRAGALNAIFYAVLILAIYISGRFEQRWLTAGIMAGGLAVAMWGLRALDFSTSGMIMAAIAITLILCWILKLKFALGALVADIHDMIIIVGIFSIFDLEFDLTTVAALLTILGYSLNDTIIVYDRIRENVHIHKDHSFEQIINDAVNQTLSRTLLVSGITLLTVVCLFFFGGTVLREFSLAMIIGVVTGTYSSVFVASPILIDLGGGLESIQDAAPSAASGAAPKSVPTAAPKPVQKPVTASSRTVVKHVSKSAAKSARGKTA